MGPSPPTAGRPAAAAPAPRPSQRVIRGLEGPPAPQPGVSQNGTEQAPLFVRVLPEPKTTEQAEAERREQAARAANERGLTKYTQYLWRATAALTLVAGIQAG